MTFQVHFLQGKSIFLVSVQTIPVKLWLCVQYLWKISEQAEGELRPKRHIFMCASLVKGVTWKKIFVKILHALRISLKIPD